MTRTSFSLLLGVILAAGALAQGTAAPQSRLSFEDRAGTAGHTIVLDGKSYGPYKEILIAAYSTSGMAAAFAVTKRDRTYVVAQGREAGPIPAGFDIDRLQVSDDGKVWILTATRASEAEDDPAQTLLLVNGKTYGPYLELTTVEYAETGGAWIAAVRTAEEEADVLWAGKPQGPFYSVDHAWVTPDGKSWGYAVSDSDGVSTVVTPEKTWTKVAAGFFGNLYPREPHWGYALRFGQDEERIVVDGQAYEGYRGFQGLILTPSGNHWAFEVEKVADGSPVIFIDGREYAGEGVAWSRLGSQETFTWTTHEGTKTNVQTLKLAN